MGNVGSGMVRPEGLRPVQHAKQTRGSENVNDKIYCIEVVEAETDEVVKTIEAANLRTAERTEDGMNINLNHMQFFTRIREKEKP